MEIQIGTNLLIIWMIFTNFSKYKICHFCREILRDKVNLCKQLDFVISRIDPGYSEIRSFIQKELHFSTLILNQMDVEAGLTDIVTYSEVYRISMKALNELERQRNQIKFNVMIDD